MNRFDEDTLPDEESSEPLAEFEQRLKEALRRVDAPAGFADRVMAQTGSAGSAQRRVLLLKARPSPWLPIAAAAALLVSVFGAEQIHLHRQRVQAEMVQQQFEAGIRITDQALDHAREQLQRAGIGQQTQ